MYLFEKGEKIMFSFRVNDSISLELLQQYQFEEIFELIDHNREHLRQWLL